MRTLLFPFSFLFVSVAHASEPSASELSAKRLLEALITAKSISEFVLLKDLDIAAKRECFVALDAISTPNEFGPLAQLGPENEEALAELAENLEQICSRGAESKLELFGLGHLTEAAKESATWTGQELEGYLWSMIDSVEVKEYGTGDTATFPHLPVIIGACWNVGALSLDALNATIAVGFTVSENGVPESSTFEKIGSTINSPEAALQAFEAARRAIVRCGVRGLNVPQGHYRMEFGPEGISLLD